jgi:O-antigen/teichoic acid export membrane protein
MLLCGLVLLVGGNKLLQMLPGGGGLTASRTLIIAMTGTFLARAWVDGRSIILNSAEVLVPQAFFYGGHAVLNVALAIVLGRMFGVEGVACATPITAMATSVWGYHWMIRRYIFRRPGAIPPLAATVSEKT